MLEWHWGTVRIRVEFSFFAMLSLLCIVEQQGMVLTLLCAALLHELGHMITMYCCGQPPSQLIATAAGMQLVPRRDRMPGLAQELLILASGPLMNLLLGVGFYWLGRPSAAGIHLLLGMWNLLPYHGLDGGTALSAIAQACLGAHWTAQAERMLCGFRILFTCCLVAALLYSGIRNLSLYALLLYLAVCEIL